MSDPAARGGARTAMRHSEETHGPVTARRRHVVLRTQVCGFHAWPAGASGGNATMAGASVEGVGAEFRYGGGHLPPSVSALASWNPRLYPAPRWRPVPPPAAEASHVSAHA